MKKFVKYKVLVLIKYYNFNIDIVSNEIILLIIWTSKLSQMKK
jgi:hypothetical protein